MDEQDLLSAFLDGEEVRTAEILGLLDTPSGQRAALDFLRLRAATQSEARPSEAFYERVRPLLIRRGPRAGHWINWRFAAGLVLSATVGLWAGSTFVEPPVDGPPVPVRIVEFEPGVDWQSTESISLPR